MTARQLFNELQDYFDAGGCGSTTVAIGFNYGDHWNTFVCPEANEIDVAKVEYSDYHRQNKLADEDADDPEEVLVISADGVEQ